MIALLGRALPLLLLVGCSAAPSPQVTTADPVATAGPTAAQASLATTAPVAVVPTDAPLPAPAATPPDTAAVTATSASPGSASVADASTSAPSSSASVADAPIGAASAESGVPARNASLSQVAGSSALAAAQSQPAEESPCDATFRPNPLPAPGSARAQDFFRSFRTPLAPAPLFDPPGPRRVGLQAGHWRNDEIPPELGRLQAGAVGGGKQEWEVNLDVAQRTAALLRATGVQVDVLPATVPPRYQANAFIALHADGDAAGMAHGFKVARPGFSSLPDVDDRLVDTLNQVYATDTELPRDDGHISLRMRYYYAFNSRRYCHAVATGVPQAIIEMGYLTSVTDRRLLIGDPDRLAQGLADGIQAFLSTLP